MKHLYYAEIISRLYEIEKSYRDVLQPVVGVKDQKLFSEIHNKREENWNLIKRMMAEGAKNEISGE